VKGNRKKLTDFKVKHFVQKKVVKIVLKTIENKTLKTWKFSSLFYIQGNLIKICKDITVWSDQRKK